MMKAILLLALDIAQKNGAQECRVSLSTGTSNVFEYRNTQMDKLQQSSENKLTIELFVDGRYGVYATNRLERDDLAAFIRQAIETTRYLAEDPYRSLPDPALYYDGNDEDLDLYDLSYNKFNTAKKLSLVQNTVNEVYGSDPRIISVSAEFSDAKSVYYIIDSNGFEGKEISTYYNLSASVSLKDSDDARPEAYWYDVAVHQGDLQKKGIGTKALQKALRKLGQQKVKSGKYAMLVDNMNVGRLLSPLIAAMYGSGLQQKNSFLIDKLNTLIAAKQLTIIDDPHIPRTIGSRLFDDEGIATKKRAIIEKGILKTYFFDTYYAKKMNVQPTIGGPSVLRFELGGKNQEQLIATMKKGILITGFNGGNSNSSTGDFSFGVEGFLIENGRLSTPVSEMNITGNILDLWQNILEIGNDPRHHSAWQTPSILFDNVDFSGC